MLYTSLRGESWGGYGLFSSFCIVTVATCLTLQSCHREVMVQSTYLCWRRPRPRPLSSSQETANFCEEPPRRSLTLFGYYALKLAPFSRYYILSNPLYGQNPHLFPAASPSNAGPPVGSLKLPAPFVSRLFFFFFAASAATSLHMAQMINYQTSTESSTELPSLHCG